MPRPAADDDATRDQTELKEARAVLLAFAAAMAEWERGCAAQARQRPLEQMDRNEVHELHEAQRASCQAIFDRFCTDRPRGNARPGVVRYAERSDYDAATFRIGEVGFNKSRRIVADAVHGRGGRVRFTLVKKKEGWRVDQREAWMDGAWMSVEL